MFALDLHVHTWYSRCSNMSPRCVVAVARRQGLNGIAITDHNSIRGWKSLGRKLWKGIRIIPSIEVASSRGDILGYFVEEPVKSKVYEDVVDEILDLGGFPVLAHPFDRFRRSACHPEKPLSVPHGIEAINGRCVLSSANQRARAFAERYRLPVTGGSDAHFHSEVGHGITIFDSLDAEDILSNLFRNHLWVEGSSSSLVVHPATFVVRKMRRILRKGPLYQ